LWIHVSTDPSYPKRPNFLVLLGLRELEKDDDEEEEEEEDDDDDEEDVNFEAIVLP